MPVVGRFPTATSTARRRVAHLGGTVKRASGGRLTSTRVSPGTGVCRCIHSRQAAMTIELTGIPVRADAWSRRGAHSLVDPHLGALCLEPNCGSVCITVQAF